MNVCHLLGRVVTDPILESTLGGRRICRFQLATSNGKDRAPTKHNIVIWGKSPKDDHPANVHKYVQRGARVQVTGKITENRWQPKGSIEWRVKTEIIASNIEFVAKSNLVSNTQEEPVDAIN